MLSLRAIAALLAGLAAGAVAFAAVAALTAPREPVVVEGLTAPRGLHALDDGGLLVAEGGGRILRIDRDGGVTVVADKLHTVTGSVEEGEYTIGPSGVTEDSNGAVYFVVGEFRDKGFREAYRLEPDGRARPLTGQDPTGLDPPNLLTNPYDLDATADGGLLVSDSGWNAVLRVTPDGEVVEYAALGPLPDGAQSVPTGMARGPDGALYVAALGGLPHPPGGAVVYRVADVNGDGDAMDAGEAEVYAEGLTAATAVAFDGDGSLLVTEFSSDFGELVVRGYDRAAELPGRLVRWTPNGARVVRGGLVTPTFVAVTSEGRVFVSEEFAGRVREIGGDEEGGGGAARFGAGAAAGLLAAAGAYAWLGGRGRRRGG